MDELVNPAQFMPAPKAAQVRTYTDPPPHALSGVCHPSVIPAVAHPRPAQGEGSALIVAARAHAQVWWIT